MSVVSPVSAVSPVSPIFPAQACHPSIHQYRINCHFVELFGPDWFFIFGALTSSCRAQTLKWSALWCKITSFVYRGHYRSSRWISLSTARSNGLHIQEGGKCNKPTKQALLIDDFAVQQSRCSLALFVKKQSFLFCIVSLPTLISVWWKLWSSQVRMRRFISDCSGIYFCRVTSFPFFASGSQDWRCGEWK